MVEKELSRLLDLIRENQITSLHVGMGDTGKISWEFWRGGRVCILSNEDMTAIASAMENNTSLIEADIPAAQSYHDLTVANAITKKAEQNKRASKHSMDNKPYTYTWADSKLAEGKPVERVVPVVYPEKPGRLLRAKL